MARSRSTTSLTKKQEISNHHWTGRKPNPNKYFGFVYEITNDITGEKYIGRKYYWSKKAKPKIAVKDMNRPTFNINHWKPSDWKNYKSSSDYLKADIDKYGKENFTFKILSQWRSSLAVQYMEVKTIWKRDAIGSDLYYNKRVDGIEFPCPEECK